MRNQEMYNKNVIDAFQNPKNMGEIKNPDGIGKVGNPVCGDLMWVYIKVKNDVLTDIKVKTFGCVAAIATSSTMTEMAKGKTVQEAMKLTNLDVAKKLGGLPPIKMHCSNLAAEALHNAIKDYLSGKGKKEKKTSKKE